MPPESQTNNLSSPFPQTVFSVHKQMKDPLFYNPKYFPGIRIFSGEIAGYAMAEHMEVIYNRQRKQARLGFLSPAAFKRLFYEKRLAA
jgi:hypothetical protein